MEYEDQGLPEKDSRHTGQRVHGRWSVCDIANGTARC